MKKIHGCENDEGWDAVADDDDKDDDDDDGDDDGDDDDVRDLATPHPSALPARIAAVASVCLTHFLGWWCWCLTLWYDQLVVIKTHLVHWIN